MAGTIPRTDFAPREVRLPVATIAEMPVAEHGIVRSIPMIFCLMDDGDVLPVVDAFAYARARSVTHSPVSVSKDIGTLSRLANFTTVALAGRPMDDKEQDYLVYAYLATRASGTRVFNSSDPITHLDWKPIGTASLRREYAAIVRYFEFCSKNFGRAELGRSWTMVGDTHTMSRMKELRRLRRGDFFAHLSAARLRWHDIRSPGASTRPLILRHASSPNKVRAFPSTDEIWAIINSEKNPAYRALWVTAAFAGLRISEQLNTWSCDVLPGVYRPYFFPEFRGQEISERVFLRAHPVTSTYTGIVGSGSVERRSYLQATYGLEPRCDLSGSNPFRAGWKGTIVSGEHDTHQVFWANSRARRLFEECHDEIAAFHDIERTWLRHPYLIVNMSDRAGFRRGEPMKMSAVQAAFERAFLRVGLEPRRFGRNLHGMRHHYKWLLRNDLGLSEEHVQICLGHASIESQESYGRSSRSAHEALTTRGA